MSHVNAVLTPRTRLRLARMIVDGKHPVSHVAKLFMVSPVPARKWADRYRAEGATGMKDRSSRPHGIPHRTSEHMKRKIIALRWRQRLGPAQIAARLGIPASTVHAVHVRCHVNRLSRIGRVSGEPLRRYEHDRPASLIHVDVTKFGNIPVGGGWRFVGKQQGDWNRQATARRTGQRNSRSEPRLGTAFVHTVLDGHSRVAYAEIHSDEKAITAIGVLERAVTARRDALPDWLHFYNQHRHHSAINDTPYARLNNLPGQHS
ncbi:helix-turn-helix domain-containing protein [Microbacterium aurugineum]|uniref:DDE-type integrase/transposase/recombinase n=1 Tax=Microbacterium aurugineum TaxID=2851642 RepID=A0ABY4J1A3_9MICO|nr:leucine zipper domain-containing protein [Microbacterium aurugineum]UPL17801.1 DDE-type integrase/transposase/recombinase [Microbacterium aurugineum]